MATSGRTRRRPVCSGMANDKKEPEKLRLGHDPQPRDPTDEVGSERTGPSDLAERIQKAAQRSARDGEEIARRIDDIGYDVAVQHMRKLQRRIEPVQGDGDTHDLVRYVQEEAARTAEREHVETELLSKMSRELENVTSELASFREDAELRADPKIGRRQNKIIVVGLLTIVVIIALHVFG